MDEIGTTVIVCGGRNFADSGVVAATLLALDAAHGPLEIVTGGAAGADSIGHRWATERGHPTRVFPADWATHGRAAGPIRNEQMLREGQPDIVVAFPGGRGTANMVALAKAAGVRVIEVSA